MRWRLVVLRPFLLAIDLDQFEARLRKEGSDLGGGVSRAAARLVAEIDSKISPLLTHVSLMIAGLAVLFSNSSFSKWKTTLVGVEIFFYIFIALGCLICIHIDQPKGIENEYTPGFVAEAALKTGLFSFLNIATILLTATLLVTTPIIILI